MNDVLPDVEKDRHYLNVGRVAVVFAACEDHAAYLLFATRKNRLPEDDEHLELAKFSDELRKALKNEVAPVLAEDLARFSQYRNRLAHSVMRYDYVETEPDENGFRLIAGFESHRTVNPRSGMPMPIPDDDEVETRLAEMNHWCRAVWVRAKEVGRHE
ncbi:hypothetical protein [Kribbella shirazensis]|uniref:Uncharacterized protein n=1 Tax=Kribbella shirazensis TaxID=1105143 RepID=A0A7X5V4T1_9ACTN|nr:hypothetical protein [Kribbella shirazensis]NIK54625.1 hypothetical protein [Kribbella shirazensis]